MSSVNKRYSHSFAQTTDDSAAAATATATAPPSEQAAVAASAHHDHTVDNLEAHLDDPASAYQEASPDELLPPPDFRPFFALIEDPDTGEYHHPSVHYIFSDDNPDFVTSTIVDAIEQGQAEATTDQPAPTNPERMILVDVGPDGKSVSEAQSLSADWQIMTTTIGQAPSWADETSRKDVPGLMLSMQGLESHKLKLQPDRRRSSQDDPVARVEAMMGGYNGCLATLEKLMKKDVLEQGLEQGLEREQGLGQEHEHEHEHEHEPEHEQGREVAPTQAEEDVATKTTGA